ncbi:MAG: metalloregulator ArsR/SmtB family transcription factor [Chloroflexaceae bacterium]|jgi:DNA-binding transcriptional ArsR family regulator|nr:metalloregulator ArsR/SmtB family transcription factor [Chloroflexaceae bacterium]
MDSDNLQITLRYLKAMAHESRLRLLGILADGEWSVTELADLLNLKEPTISHHLAKMQEVGLVRMRPVGTSHLYSLNGETLHQLNRDLLAPARVTTLANDTANDAWERKVLQSFLDGERLTTIPNQQKKRLVILKWLVERFEPGVRYAERELNAIIKRHHPDTATLRREFIANKLMQREDGIYWRIEQIDD